MAKRTGVEQGFEHFPRSWTNVNVEPDAQYGGKYSWYVSAQPGFLRFAVCGVHAKQHFWRPWHGSIHQSTTLAAAAEGAMRDATA